MRILAIDTATDAATAAVIEDDIVIGETILNHKKTHSQKIMVMIERMLSDLELEVSDIDVFAVAAGPGSFTGLRIGIATVKALAHSVNKKTVGISTLEGLAYNLLCSDKLIVPLMDARRNQVFNAAYRFVDGEIKEVIAPNVCDINECIDKVKGENVIFTGDGVNVHKALLKEYGDIAPLNLRMSNASSVALAAAIKANKGETLNYNELNPVYLRLSQAERELLEKNKA